MFHIFDTVVKPIRELIHSYNLNIEMDNESFKRVCKGAVSNKFIEDWTAELNDTQKKPSAENLQTNQDGIYTGAILRSGTEL